MFLYSPRYLMARAFFVLSPNFPTAEKVFFSFRKMRKGEKMSRRASAKCERRKDVKAGFRKMRKGEKMSRQASAKCGKEKKCQGKLSQNAERRKDVKESFRKMRKVDFVFKFPENPKILPKKTTKTPLYMCLRCCDKRIWNF